MKKRILAFALTLAMVVTSLSMLSFVSFADDVAQSESTAKDFYAYRGTLNVDSKLGVDELWVPVNKEIAPGVAVGMSWDYDNVYIAVYNEPATNGVVGERGDYIESFSFNIGGATVTGNLTENTTEVSGNGKVVLGYAGAGNPRCVIEAAFPLNEIELDTEALAAGKLVVPATLTINQVYADESLVDTTANLNVILTGRSLAYQADRINPSGASANATELFTGGQVYDRTAGVNVASSAPEEFKEMYVFSGGRGNSTSPLVAVDKSTRDGKVELIRSVMNLREVKSVDIGGQSYFEYQLTINNLPVGVMSNVDNATSFTNTASYIIINNAGIGGAKGTIVNLYNAGGEDGLSVYYPTASGNKSVSLGVEEGEEFWIGFNEVSANKIEIYVNDVLVADDAIAADSSVSSDKGYIWLGSHRGHSGVGTNGYSLDIDENGVIDEEEQISFKMADATVSSVTPVDVATVASLTKTGGEATSTILMAGATAQNTVNVATLSTATATYNITNQTVSVAVDTVNVDSFKVNVGGFEAEVTMSYNTETRPDTFVATLDADSTAAGATVAVSKASVVTVNLPLNKVVACKDSLGNVVSDVQIYVEKSDKASDKDGRVLCATDGSFDGTLVFVLGEASNIMSPTVLNTAAATTANGTAGVFVGGGVGTENYGKLIYRQAKGQTITPDSYFVSLGNSAGVNAVRRFYFDITVEDMTPVDVNSVVYNSNVSARQDYDKINMHFGSNIAPEGSVIFNLVNTTNGGSKGGASLVLAYYNLAEKKTYIIPLDKTVGEKFNFELYVDATDNYRGAVLVDGVAVFENENMRSSENMTYITGSVTSGPYFRVLRGNKTGTAAFNFTIEKFTLHTFKPADTAEKILAATAKSNRVESAGSIKLSYVQETTPTAVETYTSTTLTHNVAAGNGASAAAGNAVMSVKNTAARAYAQGGLQALSVYGNRTISYKLNVAELNAYDFSNGATIEGDEKYTTNISGSHGATAGVGGDMGAAAFDKLIIGAISKTNEDTEYSAVIFWVVRDTNDGLVLTHTAFDGTVSYYVIGDKMGEDIAVTLVWNKNNKATLTVNGETAMTFAGGDARTIISQFPKKDADKTPQCYFGGYGTVSNGYFGLNAVWNTDTNDAVPEATLTLTEVESVYLGTPLNVRFVATIDTLDAKVAGFDINLKGSEKVVTKTTDTAYNAISTNGDLDKIYAPDGSYFIAVTINDVPATGTVTFVVRPFYTFAGETIYGTAYEVTYTNGAYVGAVAVAE